MLSNQAAQRPPEFPDLAINQLGIILTAPRIDPAHINPDFLRNNHIVETQWNIEYPVITEAGLSLVQYSNGLSFMATNDRLEISHRGESLAADRISSPVVADKYLAMAPWPVDYNTAHTELDIQLEVAERRIEHENSPLQGFSSGLLFQNTNPSMQTRAVYQLADKWVTMTVSETATDNIVNSIRFNLHLCRNLDQSISTDERTEFVKSVIRGWKEDIDNLIQLALQFYRKYGD